MAKSTPLQFDIPSLRGDEDVEKITAAARRVDPGASVSADVQSKRVVIGGDGEPHDFIRAIQDAGFEVKAAE